MEGQREVRYLRLDQSSSSLGPRAPSPASAGKQEQFSNKRPLRQNAGEDARGPSEELDQSKRRYLTSLCPSTLLSTFHSMAVNLPYLVLGLMHCLKSYNLRVVFL